MEAAKIYSIVPNAAQAALNYIEKNNLTKTKFAELIDCNRSTLSIYLSGKYVSDTSEIENKILSYLKNVGFIQDGEFSMNSAMQKPSFFITQDASSILAVCQSCQDYMALGVIVGKSGFGKTYTLKQFAKSARVCYVECDDSMSPRDLVKAIEKNLGIPNSYGSIWDRVSNIKDFFNVNSGYLLIIDEADKLITKYTQKKAEILRTIFDQSDVGLVLAGEPSLESKIKVFIPRLANRVDFYASLKGIAKKEVEEYLQDYNFTDDAIREMTIRANNSQTGCFRLLDRTLKNALRVASIDEPITIDIIKKASSMMML